MYHALSAYSGAAHSLEISLIISDLVKDTINDRVANNIYAYQGKKYILYNHVTDVLKLAGLKVPNYYYYRWCVETIQEGDS